MKSVNVSIYQCNNGDIAADDIYSNKGIILLAKGTALNDYIKEKLINMGIENVKVCTSSEDINYQIIKENYLTTITQTKEFICDIAAGKKFGLEKVMSISDLVYQSINENDSMLKCINEMQKADEYTYTHCINVAFYSMLIGKWMKLSEVEIKKLVLSGLLHDIGKLKIPEQILNKKDKLTKEEFDIIKNHTILGFGILENIDGIDIDVKHAVLLHHERIDGSGYPFNFLSNNISLYARIVAVADVYDAMTSERSYKKRATPFETFEMFKTIGLGAFDTTILSTFLRHIATCYVGTSITLNNGDIGKVVYIPPHDIVYPIISVGPEYIDLSLESNLKVASIGGIGQ
jgi:putative nucleotidyltransferase with HDIG domain